MHLQIFLLAELKTSINSMLGVVIRLRRHLTAASLGRWNISSSETFKEVGKEGEVLLNEDGWFVYLGFVGKLHQMLHKGSGLGVLRITHLLHLQVTLCAKRNVTSVWM